jgi:hypothetical protein
MVSVPLLAVAVLTACSGPVPTGYRTYSLPDKGIAHLSFEYPASFNVRQVQLYDDSDYERMDIDGPYSRQTRDRTTMWVVAQRYTSPITVGDLVDSAQAVASGLAGYRLLERGPFYFNGITAEQFSYFYYAARSEYERKILGFTPAPTVARQIYFSLDGLQWTIAMTADEATVDADTPGFEHLLQTFTLLP